MKIQQQSFIFLIWKPCQGYGDLSKESKKKRIFTLTTYNFYIYLVMKFELTLYVYNLN